MKHLYKRLRTYLHYISVGVIKRVIKVSVLEIIGTEPQVWGDSSRLQISPKAAMVNTLYNTSSGKIIVGDYTFTGHNVSLLTGTHDYELLLEKRMLTSPSSGRDIVIGKGVWIGSNVTVLGPCKIDDHAVIGAGSVVLPRTNIKAKSLYAGIPALFIKKIHAKN